MKFLVQSLITGALATTALAVSPALASDAKNEETKSKAPKKITDRRHPDYVRCRSEPIIGSLSRKRRICMTNNEWVEYTRVGSRDSRDFVEDAQPGFMILPN